MSDGDNESRKSSISSEKMVSKILFNPLTIDNSAPNPCKELMESFDRLALFRMQAYEPFISLMRSNVLSMQFMKAFAPPTNVMKKSVSDKAPVVLGFQSMEAS